MAASTSPEDTGIWLAMHLLPDERCGNRGLFGFGPLCGAPLVALSMSPRLQAVVRESRIDVQNGERLCVAGSCALASGARLKPLLGVVR